MGIRVDGGDEAAGTFDTGGAQRCLLGRVALDLEEALAPRPAQRFGQDVDDHDLAAGMDELTRHRLPHTAVSAQDVVA